MTPLRGELGFRNETVVTVTQANDKSPEPTSGLARRLFRAVGQAAGWAAGGALRTAGKTVKGATDRVRLTFSGEVSEAPPWDLREIAESLARWLVEECQGTADLQHQKPSTVELSEVGAVGSHYEIVMEEPGLTGRRFRFLVRSRPLSDLKSNLPASPGATFSGELLVVKEWPGDLTQEPKGISCLLWDQASAVGPRNSAHDLAQRWLGDVLGGGFARRKILAAPLAPTKKGSDALLGRESELQTARQFLGIASPRAAQARVLALAAPGGTGKSFFLRALQQESQGRVLWSAVDHQSLGQTEPGVGFLAKLLALLGQGLERQGMSLPSFRKEYLRFQKERESQGESSGLIGHVRKAIQSAAGINPAWGAASAGVTFLASWGEEVRQQSEALAKNDAVLALTAAFQYDLREWVEQEREQSVLWRRPVLVFDTYEWLAPAIDVWLRTQLLHADWLQEEGALVILAGRDHPLRVDTRWAELSSVMTVLELQAFSRSTSDQLLDRLQVPPERFEHLFELTGGLPLFLSLAAHISSTDEACEILGRRILEEVPQDLWSAFRRASVLDEFTSSSLQKAFPEFDPEKLGTLLEQLSMASFTESRDGRRGFIPGVRNVLLQNLKVAIGEADFQALRESVRGPRGDV